MSYRKCLGAAFCLLVGCGTAVDGEDEQTARDEVAGVYSSQIRPLQPAMASSSNRSIYVLEPDGRGTLRSVFCDGRTRDVAEFEWSVSRENGSHQIRLDFLSAGGGESVSFWSVPGDCSSDASWRVLDENGAEGAMVEPGRYCNPMLSGYNEFDNTNECAFELCREISKACGGEGLG